MRKKWVRAVAAFLVVAFVVAVMPELNSSMELSAESTDFTVEQAVQWINEKADTGWGEDVDRTNGVQCVDLVKAYYQYLGYAFVAGDAWEYASNNKFLMNGWYRDETPSPGAIIVWNKGVYTDLRGSAYGDSGSTGHVGLVAEVSGSFVYTVETNYAGRGYAYKVTRQPANAVYIHPNFNSGQPSGSPLTSGKRTIPDGDYYIASYDNDDYVMTVSESSTKNGANVQLWKSFGDISQVFSIKYLNNGFYSIINKYTGKSLDVANQSMLRDTNIHQWEVHGDNSQQWAISQSYNADTGYTYVIKSKLNGWTVDIDGAIIKDGTNIKLWEESGNPHSQNWKLIPCGYWSGKPLSDGYYSLKNKYSGYGIGVNGTLASETDAVSTFASDRFKLDYQMGYKIDGYYQISLNNYSFDVYNDSKYSGANVQYFTPHNKDNQKWFIKSAGDGYYYIISRVNRLYLTYSGSSIVTGNWSIDNDDKFKWKIERWNIPIISGLTTDPITYGQTLDDLNLTAVVTGDDEVIPGHFEWFDYNHFIPSVAYAKENKFSAIFIPDDAVLWEIVQVDFYITVNPADYPPNRPGETISPSVGANTLSKVPLPEKWEWVNKDTPLEMGVPVTAEAVYTGYDAGVGNFVHEKVTVTVTRQPCSHPEDKREIRNAVDPSCTEAGYTGDIYCTECGIAIETGNEANALGHSWSGYEKDKNGHTRTCSRCNETDTNAHDFDGGVTTKAPTCAEEGEITYTCLTCGYQNTKISQKLSHQFGDWKNNEAYHWEECEVCHEHRNEALHTFGDWTVTVQPTTETEGEKSRSCDICSYKETEKIDKLEQPTESSSESPTETSSESPTETQSETPVETPSETSTETPPETPVETSSETPAETPSESSTETPPETPAVTPSGSPAEAPSETPAGTPSESPIEIPTISSTVTATPVSETGEMTSADNTATNEAASTEANLPHISIICKSGTNAPAAAISNSLSELREIISEKTELKNGSDVTVLLTVNDISDTVSETDKALAETALNGYTAAMYLDISLSEIINSEVLKITDTKAPLSVTVEIPPELRKADREFALIRIHDGKAELLKDVDGDPDTVTVETDKFSTYVVAYKDAEKTDDRDKNIATGAMLTALPPAAAAAAVVIVLRKRRK